MNKFEDDVLKKQHHLNIDAENSLGEIAFRFALQAGREEDDVCVSKWLLESSLFQTRGAVYLWLTKACVARHMLNLQEAHDYTGNVKTGINPEFLY